MFFSDIYGQEHIKEVLTHGVDVGRVPQAQLFIGPEGTGTLPMAIAYAQYILCKNSGRENTSGDASCNLKCNHLSHPDLHFAFPVSTSDEVKTHPTSSKFLESWQHFVKEKPYGSEFDWYKFIGVEKKQGLISVDEAYEILNKLYLKPCESTHKVMIIWMCERMNTTAANKLLKIIEEPPKNTIFILTTEHEEQLLDTIRSRCQNVYFTPIPQTIITKALTEKGITLAKAQQIAHQAQGNINRAFELANETNEEISFEKWFISWVRTAFRAKNNKSSILDLLEWSKEISKTGRETQKRFIDYCIEIFRQALMKNYNAESLVFIEFQDKSFLFDNFVPFVNSSNFMGIIQELEKAAYHIERNGNAEMIFTDMSIRLTRMLHSKEANLA